MHNARLTRFTVLALSLVLGPQAAVSPAAAEQSTTGGPAALALAAVVARQSPLVSAGDKSVLASLFDGKSASYPVGKSAPRRRVSPMEEEYHPDSCRLIWKLTSGLVG